MAAVQNKIKPAQTKKELKKELVDKIEPVLTELKTTLGEKEFQQRIKKAAKMLTRGLHSKNLGDPNNKPKPSAKIEKAEKTASKNIKSLKKAKAKKEAGTSSN